MYATKQEMATCLTKDDASKTYQTKVDCEANYLTKASASEIYATSEKVASDYLKKASASESYLTKTQASQTYLTSEKASSDYLKKANASESYLTKTQASQTYLTSEKASNDYLTKVKAGQEYATKEEVDNLSFGLFFDDYQSFLQNANLNQNQHKINCVIRIKSGKICDLCVSAIKTEFVNCELTEEEFASALLNVGVVQVGYCEYIPAKALAYSDSLPEVSKEDAGKYLSVNDNGEWQADRIEAYVGEVEGGTVVETIKGVGIKEIYSGESVNYGDVTITPVTFVKSDDSQRTIDIAAKNGTDIISVESGSVSESDDYSIIPITFNKNDGNSFSTQIMVKNGRNGIDGVSITSIIYGQPTIDGEYTVTPITFTKSNGTSVGAYIKAKSGRGIASFEIVDGKIIVNYSDGASENIGALYDVANSNSFGLIKADAKYISDTMPVRISTDGKLYTNPGTLYSHTITISGSTFKCMINILSAKNTTVADQLTLNSIISSGYHVATGKINSNAIMAVRRANTAFYMIDINGTETSVAYKDMTFSDVVRSISAEVVT